MRRDPRLRRKVSDGPFRPAANVLTIPDPIIPLFTSLWLCIHLKSWTTYPSIVLHDKQGCDVQQAIVRIKLL